MDNGLVKSRAIIPAGIILLLAVAGCVPQVVEPGQSAAPTPTSSPSRSTPPSAEPTAEPGATPIGFGCAEFISAQAMYDYNSIFSAVDFEPAAGTVAADAVANEGIACRWVNTSSGTTIDFSVAMPSLPALEARRSALQGGEASAFDGYFDADTAQVFAGGYWIAVTSSEFLGDGDAAPLVEIALNGLP